MASIDQTVQLTEQLEKQNKLYAAQGQMLKGQLAIMKQMQDIFNGMNNGQNGQELDEITEKAGNAGAELEAFGSKSQKTMNALTNSMKKATMDSGKFGGTIDKMAKKGPAIAVLALAFDGMTEGIKFSMNAMTSLGSIAGTVIGSLTNLGFAIVTLPFKMLQGLINMTDGGGGSGLREALEAIRGEFGALKTGASEAIIDVSRGMKGELAETGLSSYRIFGNLAERLKTVTEYAKNMGNAFDLVRKSFVENGERIGAYIKGLGLGEEGQRALAQTAIRMGTSLQEVGREITTFAYGMGEAFGINGRQISGDVGKMMDDFQNFGNLGVQTLTNISVYARKLGVEFKDLQGVIGKFDNFEEAAQGAAQLQQAFGLQLDTLQLINAQDPAERIEMLRKSFFDAGRSIENMTRQERALLATQTGLDQKTASLVFSMESQGQSYADIQKASDTTKKKQLSQAEAMEKLSDSIQRLVKSGGSGSGGFFDRFLQGFSKGIRKSAEFRDLMRSLRQSLLNVRTYGIQVGQAFVNAFPGVREMIKGLADFFDPGRFRKAMRGTVDIFKKFFKGDLNLDGFQKELKKNFSDFFDIDSPAGQKFIAGVKKFFHKLRDLFVEGISIGMRGLRNGAKFLVDLIKNPQKALAAASSASSGVSGFFIQEIVQPILSAIKTEGPSMLQAFGELFGLVFRYMVKKISELAIEYREPIAKAFITIFVAPAMISSISRGLIGGVGVAVAKGLSGALKKGITALRQGQASAAQAGGGALGGTGSGGVGADVLGGRQGNMISRSIDGLGEILESARNINLGGVRKLFDIGVGFAVFGAGVIVALAGLVWLVAAVNLSVVDIAKTVFVMGAALAVGTALGLAVKGLQAIGASVGMVKEAAIGFAAIAVTGLAVIGGLWGLSQAAKVLDAGDVMVVSGVMLATIPIVLALAAIMAVLTGTGMLAVATSGVAVVGFVALAATVVGAGELARESVDAFSGTVVQQVIDTGLKISAITYVVAGLSAILTVLTGSGILGAMGVLGIIGGVALTSTITGAAALTQKAITGFSDINITQVQAAGEKIKSIAFIIGGLAVVGASLLVAGVSAGLQKVADWLGIGGTAITDLVERMEGTTKSIIDAANRLNITDAELASINKIKTIIEVIGSFAEVYSKLASAAGPSLAGAAVNGESLGQNLLVIGSVVNLLPIQISAVVNSLKGIASTVSEEDVKKIGMVGEILTHVGNFVGSIISAATSFPQTGEAALGRNLKKITNFLKNIGPSIGEIFSSIGTSIIDVVSSSGFNIKSFTAATQGFSSILGTLGTFVTNMLKASTEGTGGSGATQAAAAYISSTVESITGAFSGNAIKEGQLTRLMDTVGELGQGMSASKLKGIERFGTGLASISEAMSTIAQNSDHITGESMLRVQTSVAAMVHGIKEIGESIKSLKGININSELRGLASRLGLESREQLRIEHGNLNITINLKVQVDAEELERVLLNREGRQFMSKADTGQ